MSATGTTLPRFEVGGGTAGEDALLFVRSRLEPGDSGNCRLELFEISKLPEARAARDARPQWARNAPGVYRRLRVGNQVMMTDTYDEWWTQRRGIAEACRRGGHVLVTGLGLGVVVESMLATPGSRVERITVLEASADVIALVAPQLQRCHAGRLEIVNADAFEWRPPAGVRFTVGWHDIWPSPYMESNLPEMRRLEGHYAPFCDWQGFWGRELIVGSGREPAA
ncbi:MAG: hypothetical protein MI919_03060 [Holophagales bacterium]|nr:hypothetical protein [Holophagales bacterium]